MGFLKARGASTKARLHSFNNLRIVSAIANLALIVSLSSCATQHVGYSVGPDQLEGANFIGKKVKFCLISKPCRENGFQTAVVATKGDGYFTAQDGEKFMYTDIEYLSFDAPQDGPMDSFLMFFGSFFPVGK